MHHHETPLMALNRHFHIIMRKCKGVAIHKFTHLFSFKPPKSPLSSPKPSIQVFFLRTPLGAIPPPATTLWTQKTKTNQETPPRRSQTSSHADFATSTTSMSPPRTLFFHDDMETLTSLRTNPHDAYTTPPRRNSKYKSSRCIPSEIFKYQHRKWHREPDPTKSKKPTHEKHGPTQEENPQNTQYHVITQHTMPKINKHHQNS